MEEQTDMILRVTTAVVAAYGAILSSYVALRTLGKDRRRLRISAGLGVIARGPQYERTVVTLRAENIGHRGVQLSSCGFVVGGSLMFVPTGIQGSVVLPTELKDGAGCSMLIEVHDLVERLKQVGFGPRGKVRVFFKDALGTTFTSKPWAVDLRKL